MQKSYLMGTQDPHLLRTMRESGRRPNTAVGEATGTAEGQGAGSGNVPVEVYSRGSLGLVGDDFGTIFGHRPKAASGEREPLYTRVRNCLPRLNQACPNPSKWRESLGFASWARGQCSGHCGDAHPGVPPRPRTPIMMAPCAAAGLRCLPPPSFPRGQNLAGPRSGTPCLGPEVCTTHQRPASSCCLFAPEPAA